MRLKSFTLTELLVALVIIGILMLIAIPNLMPLISKTHSLEAQQALTTIERLQKTYRMVHMKYSDELPVIGFQLEPTVLQDGKSKYRIEITKATASGFEATAEAVVDFDGDGVYNMWKITQEGNLEEVTPD